MAYQAMPEPEQLFEIARIGICLAKEQGKLRESRQTYNAHIFLADELSYVEVKSEEDYQQTTHKFIGRIGRIGFRHWSMRIAEPYWVSDTDGEDGYRASYIFEWTDKGVLQAKRRMKAKSDPDDSPDDSVLLQQSGSDIQPDFLHAVTQYETISKADCGELILAMKEFTDVSRSLAK